MKNFKLIYETKIKGGSDTYMNEAVDENLLRLYCNKRYRILKEDVIVKCFKKCDIYQNGKFDIYSFHSALELCGFALSSIYTYTYL